MLRLRDIVVGYSGRTEAGSGLCRLRALAAGLLATRTSTNFTLGLSAGCLLLVFLLPLNGCGGGASWDESQPYGLIPLESPEYYFGECRQAETLKHTFSLLNNAEKPVRIVGIQTSCQCTVAGELGSLTIGPSERFSLPVYFTTAGSLETASSRVTVRYRDAENETSPLRGELGLIVSADVLPDYRITPPSLDFGTIDGLSTEGITRTVRIGPHRSGRCG